MPSRLCCNSSGFVGLASKGLGRYVRISRLHRNLDFGKFRGLGFRDIGLLFGARGWLAWNEVIGYRD